MRDGGFTDADERCDIAHAQFAARERVEDANPRWITKNPECIGQGLDRSHVEERRFALFGEMRCVAFRGDVYSFGNRHMNI